MTNTQILRNQRAVEHAIAQQKLEGLTVPPEAIGDLERIARGEMTTVAALDAARARFTHAEIFQ